MNGAASRTAIVTGGARGIGAGIVARLARAGTSVAAIDLDLEALTDIVDQLRNRGGSAIAVQADVGDEHAVRNALNEIAQRLGPPAILVNNAGLARDMNIEDTDCSRKTGMPSSAWTSVRSSALALLSCVTRSSSARIGANGSFR